MTHTSSRQTHVNSTDGTHVTVTGQGRPWW